MFKFFVVATILVGCAKSTIDDLDYYTANDDEFFFRVFENALLSNGSNRYKLRRLFNTEPPKLANITYELWFNNSNTRRLPICTGTSNQTYINDNEIVELRYGWTSSGIYTLIHPAILNLLQIQLPFAIMRYALKCCTNADVDRYPFLWNGIDSHLPSISLHLIISTHNLRCLPGDNQLEEVMKTLTTYVSIICVSHWLYVDVTVNHTSLIYVLLPSLNFIQDQIKGSVTVKSL